MSHVSSHGIAIVHDRDGLGDDSAEQVGGAEVHQHQVESAVHHFCFVPDGGDDHDVEEDADDSQGHVQDHHQGPLVHEGPAGDIEDRGDEELEAEFILCVLLYLCRL